MQSAWSKAGTPDIRLRRATTFEHCPSRNATARRSPRSGAAQAATLVAARLSRTAGSGVSMVFRIRGGA